MRRNRFIALLFVVVNIGILYINTNRSPNAILFNNIGTSASSNKDFIDFTNFNNTASSFNKLIVPNIIHFIAFDKTAINFSVLICILSAWFNQRPSSIMIHSNLKFEMDTRYMRILRSVIGDKLVMNVVEEPTHAYGKPILFKPHHSADIARLLILSNYGGIYLDYDVFVVQSLNRFRHYECTVGWPENNTVGNQVIFAHKDARFLKLWKQGYKDFHNREWYYNGGEVPSKILTEQPELVYRAKWELGVQTVLSDKLYQSNEWNDYVNWYTIHLLSDHDYLMPKHVDLTEDHYKDCNCTYATLADTIIDQLNQHQLQILHSPKNDYELISDYINLSQRYWQNNTKPPSIVKTHLNFDMLNKLKDSKTAYNSTLIDVIKSGMKNLDSVLGIYAPDPESYQVFDSLMVPVISVYHLAGGLHPSQDWGNVSNIGKLGDQVLSIKLQVSRSIEGFPFNSKMSEKDLYKVEEMIKKVVTKEFKGQYHSLQNMDQKTKTELTDKHLLFGECDRFIKGAGGCTHWPHGRAVFVSSDEKIYMWINEEEHIKIFSIVNNGDMNAVYSRLVNVMTTLEKKLKFVYNEYLGFLTFCPSNLGTTIKATIDIQIKNLNETQVKSLADSGGFLHLEDTDTPSLHSEHERNTLRLISTKRLGLTEFNVINKTYEAISSIIKIDQNTDLMPKAELYVENCLGLVCNYKPLVLEGPVNSEVII